MTDNNIILNKSQYFVKSLRDNGFEFIKETETEIEININSKGKNDYTLLHTAILSGNKEIVQLLLKNGVDKNIRSYSKTPLELAQNLLNKKNKEAEDKDSDLIKNLNDIISLFEVKKEPTTSENIYDTFRNSEYEEEKEEYEEDTTASKTISQIDKFKEIHENNNIYVDKVYDISIKNYKDEEKQDLNNTISKKIALIESITNTLVQEQAKVIPETNDYFSTDSHGDMLAFLLPMIETGAVRIVPDGSNLRVFNTNTKKFVENESEITKENRPNLILLPNVEINPDFEGTFTCGGDFMDRGQQTEENLYLAYLLLNDKNINNEDGSKKLNILIGNHEASTAVGDGDMLQNGFNFFNGIVLQDEAFEKDCSIRKIDYSAPFKGSDFVEIYHRCKDLLYDMVQKEQLLTCALLPNQVVASHVNYQKDITLEIFNWFSDVLENDTNPIMQELQNNTFGDFKYINNNKDNFKLLIEKIDKDGELEGEDRELFVNFMNYIGRINIFIEREIYRGRTKYNMHPFRPYDSTEGSPIFWRRTSSDMRPLCWEKKYQIKGLLEIVGHDPIKIIEAENHPQCGNYGENTINNCLKFKNVILGDRVSSLGYNHENSYCFHGYSQSSFIKFEKCSILDNIKVFSIADSCILDKPELYSRKIAEGSNFLEIYNRLNEEEIKQQQLLQKNISNATSDFERQIQGSNIIGQNYC